jgi:ribosomal protein L37AE/L43A
MSKRIHDDPPQPGTRPASLSDLARPQHSHQDKQCPKCNYVRKPSDTAPDWQCPCCHVAYNKVTAEYREQLQHQQYDHIEKLRKELQARKKRRQRMEFTGYIMFLGLFMTYLGLGSGTSCAVAEPNLWLLGGGIAAMMGGFTSWLGSKVSSLHLKDKSLPK